MYIYCKRAHTPTQQCIINETLCYNINFLYVLNEILSQVADCSKSTTLATFCNGQLHSNWPFGTTKSFGRIAKTGKQSRRNTHEKLSVLTCMSAMAAHESGKVTSKQSKYTGSVMSDCGSHSM